MSPCRTAAGGLVRLEAQAVARAGVHLPDGAHLGNALRGEDLSGVQCLVEVAQVLQRGDHGSRAAVQRGVVRDRRHPQVEGAHPDAVVAVDGRRGQGAVTGCGEEGVGQTERFDDAFGHGLVHRLSRQLFDEHSEDVVVGVGVGEAFTGS